MGEYFMNLDFHYYGTFVAARFAGYTHEESELIAHAAQYVDDSENSTLKNNKGEYYINDFTPIPTVNSMGECSKSISEKGFDELYRVWPVFHFLPGNYDGDGKSIKNYEGPKENSKLMGKFKWRFDSEAEEQFKLLCLSDSILVKDMINDIINPRISESFHLIGLRMHVMADTWAHKYYSGFPAWFINSHTQFSEICLIPDAPSFNSPFYLGHGQTCHSPDYPYLKYTVSPQWSNERITKDNPEDFFKAFEQMYTALYSIKNAIPFNPSELMHINESNSRIIKEILNTKLDDQSSAWKAKIPSLILGTDHLQCPKKYDKGIWLKEFLSSPNPMQTDYYKFNHAAIIHLGLIKYALSLHNLYLDTIPDERILTFFIHDTENNYISTIIPGNKPKPIISSDPIPYDFILADDNGLFSGTIFKIRSNVDLPEKNYLGAWDTNDISFYIKNYNIFKQKWKIVQEGLDEGDSINFEHPVYIMNQHFVDTPYLGINKNKKRLELFKDKYEWILNH